MGQNGPGYLSGMTEEEAQLEIARKVIEHQGNVLHMAHDMGYSREQLYRRLYRHELWGLVNKIRAEKIEREKLEKKHGLPNERGESAQDQ